MFQNAKVNLCANQDLDLYRVYQITENVVHLNHARIKSNMTLAGS